MKIEQATENTWKFWCPGCESAHFVSESWCIDTKAATISPSILVYGHQKLINEDLTGDSLTAPENITTTPRCHSFVTKGRIQYLDDCTHALAGQTVELPNWPTEPAPHSESYIDSEGSERCSTCDKWLEPGYYGIEDHLKSVLREQSVAPNPSV